jgi:hypothetical protein
MITLSARPISNIKTNRLRAPLTHKQEWIHTMPKQGHDGPSKCERSPGRNQGAACFSFSFFFSCNKSDQACLCGMSALITRILRSMHGQCAPQGFTMMNFTLLMDCSSHRNGKERHCKETVLCKCTISSIFLIHGCT